MFTGLITDIGTVRRIEALAAGIRVTLACGYDMADIAMGESIACDGACMTVVEKAGESFTVDISAESLARTTLGGWREGSGVNLERALLAGDRLGGHIVTGHVDGVAAIAERTQAGESVIFGIDAPVELARFIAEKGSVTLNGVSLTVNRVEHQRFWINLIPHTLEQTTFGQRQVGDALNLEIDIIARYLARLGSFS